MRFPLHFILGRLRALSLEYFCLQLVFLQVSQSCVGAASAKCAVLRVDDAL